MRDSARKPSTLVLLVSFAIGLVGACYVTAIPFDRSGNATVVATILLAAAVGGIALSIVVRGGEEDDDEGPRPA